MVELWTSRGGYQAATLSHVHDKLWIVDVEGTLVVIDAETFGTTPPDQLASVERAIATIRFDAGDGTPGLSAPSATPTPRVTELPTGWISGAFDVGGHTLFIECRGTGSTTVIFLVGTDAARDQLRSLEDELLAQKAPPRVCEYDRPGTGQSDPVTPPQNDLEIVDDLAKLLDIAQVPPPYVLVGHSLGGDQAWLYAGTHPKGVAGFMIMNAGFFTLDWDRVRTVWTAEEIAEEQAFVKEHLGELKQKTSPKPGVPYVVMMSTIAQCGSVQDVCGRIYPLFEEWGSDLAKRTPDGRFVEVATGHDIFETQKAVVIAELDRLLDDVRRKG